jgi:hypothetical protein
MVDAASVLVVLHRVDGVSIVDISEIHTASVFRAKALAV